MLPTEWTEYIRLDWGYTYQEWRGQDTYFPEPLAHSISYSPCTSVEGDLTFGPPGPPLVIAQSQVSAPTCFLEGLYRAITSCYVTFNLRIVEKATPPVAVESVPLMIGIKSSLAASAQFSGGTAWLNIDNAGTRVFEKRSDGGYDTGPIEVDSTATVSIQPGAVLTGSMWVSAGSVAGVTTGSVGCDFEIASDVIPGTEYQYRDFFEIEYSSDYWALGNPTPVQTSTWGKIKGQYLQH